MDEQLFLGVLKSILSDDHRAMRQFGARATRFALHPNTK